MCTHHKTKIAPPNKIAWTEHVKQLLLIVGAKEDNKKSDKKESTDLLNTLELFPNPKTFFFKSQDKHRHIIQQM